MMNALGLVLVTASAFITELVV
uniref:Uncharacterized protein n=1 Tax=Arundo donax TaxID=35708 RepID=A0A0A9C2C7_ARUDO